MKKKIYVLLVILSIFIVSGCNNKVEKKTDENLLVENKDYFIRGDFNGKYLDTKKRGYYIDTLNEPNAPYFYIICMGEQNTGGYSLEIDKVKRTDDKTEIIVKEIKPKRGDTVTMAFTYPTIIVEFPSYQENIIIKNTNGEEFTRLN